MHALKGKTTRIDNLIEQTIKNGGTIYINDCKSELALKRARIKRLKNHRRFKNK